MEFLSYTSGVPSALRPRSSTSHEQALSKKHPQRQHHARAWVFRSAVCRAPAARRAAPMLPARRRAAPRRDTTPAATVPFVSQPKMTVPSDYGIIPAYRIMDEDGSWRDEAPEIDIDEELAVSMYEHMCRLQAMDQIFYDAQRQGRISFYMTSSGEEAVHIGSAAALSADDMIFAQYREPGVLMWRGFTLQQFADQCFSNSGDPAKGRQMPVHYGSSNSTSRPFPRRWRRRSRRQRARHIR